MTTATMNDVLALLDFADTRVIQWTSTTKADLRSGHPFGGNTVSHDVVKITTAEGLAGADYQWLVEIARTLAGTPVDSNGRVERFTSLPRSWGDYVRKPDGTRLPYVEYAGPLGPYYLPVKPTRIVSVQYRRKDGTPLDKATVEQWLRPKSASKRQQLPKGQEIAWPNYSVKNLAHVKVGQTVAEGPAKSILEALLRDDLATAREIAQQFAPPAPDGVAEGE